MAFTTNRLTVQSALVFDMTGSNYAPTLSDEITTSSGSSSQMSNLLFYKGGTVTAGAAVTYDLAGSLLQPDGSACVFTKITRIVVFCTSTTGRLIIGGGTNPVSGITGYASKGCPFICGDIDVGITVTAGSTDNLKIDASSGTLSYVLLVEGRA